MKISIYDEMARIDEALIEELCWEYKNEVNVSKTRIKKLVRKNLKKDSRTGARRLKFVIICCILLMISIPACAGMVLKLDISSPVNKDNEHFVGTEVQDNYYVIYKNGKYIDSNGRTMNNIELTEMEDVLSNNRIVMDVDEHVLCPGSIVEIAGTTHTDSTFTYPKIILVNDSVCVLTQENGVGWTLEKGSTMYYDFSKIHSQTIDRQNLIVGYIKDGTLYEGEGFWDNEGQYCFEVKESGVYHIYLRSASSDYLTLNESVLSIKK